MSKDVLKSETLDNFSIQQTPEFNYRELATETRVSVHRLTSEIKSLMRRSAQDIVDIGQKLVEVKEHLGHGSFINWLKFEFNWSVSSANKFMQVWEQFKFVNFTNLNITASALYLIAAPSTPSEARAEVLKRASCGENITYTMTKEIVYQYKKTAKPNSVNLDTIDVSAEIRVNEYNKPVEAVHKKTCLTFSELDFFTEKEVNTEKLSLLVQDLEDSSRFIKEQNTTTNHNKRDTSEETVHILANTLSQSAIYQELSDVLITEIAIGIKNLSPEQVASVIRKSAASGLSNQHLEIILTEAQDILSQRQFSSNCSGVRLLG